MRQRNIDVGLRLMVREMMATLRHAGLTHDEILSLVEEFRDDSNGALKRANEQIEQIKERQKRRSLTDMRELKK